MEYPLYCIHSSRCKRWDGLQDKTPTERSFHSNGWLNGQEHAGLFWMPTGHNWLVFVRGQYWGLNSGPCACESGALPLGPCPSLNNWSFCRKISFPSIFSTKWINLCLHGGLSIYLSICLSIIYLSIHVPTYLSICIYHVHFSWSTNLTHSLWDEYFEWIGNKGTTSWVSLIWNAWDQKSFGFFKNLESLHIPTGHLYFIISWDRTQV
jgi:hypothetical protein